MLSVGMRIWIFILWTILGTWAAAQRKPNVIVILTDDQGSIDVGAYGADDIETPNLDKLAAEGVRFTQFYAAAPVCSPSRAGLLTGRYPVQAGVPGNVSSHKGGKGMPATEVTMAEMFKQAGYATAHIGKWHLGYVPENMPRGQGFDHSFGHMGGCIDNYSHFFYWNGPNRHDLHRNGVEVFHDGRYFPELMVEEAEQFMKENRDNPFFIYFAINTPHYPYQGHAKWLEKYAALPYPRRLYAAFLSTTDAYIGRLLKAMDELRLTDDTIIVFQSDHGHSTEERAHFGGGNAGPYRGAKFSLFEGGIRVPAIIRWPNHLPKGETRNQIAHSCDWLPTLADLSETPLPKHHLDGRSLAPLLKDASSDSPHDIVHWMVGRDPKKSQWAVREGPWKLIGNPNDTTNGREKPKLDNRFLSNLDSDLSETQNFADHHPEVVRRLEKAHHDWLAAVQASR